MGAADAKRAELVAARAAAERFVSDYAASRAAAAPAARRPVLLFSHVPLWRPDGTPCLSGSFARQKPPLRMTQYKYLLPRPVSGALLEALQPVAIFSGDDHDLCEFAHEVGKHEEKPPASSAAAAASSASPGRPLIIPEFTVPTFSWLQGVRRPGFSVITLAGCDAPLAPGDDSGAGADAGLDHASPGSSTLDGNGEAAAKTRMTRVEVQLCQLPDQLLTYTSYGLAALLTTVLVVVNRCGCCRCRRLLPPRGSGGRRGGKRRPADSELGHNDDEERLHAGIELSGLRPYRGVVSQRPAAGLQFEVDGGGGVALSGAPTSAAATTDDDDADDDGDDAGIGNEADAGGGRGGGSNPAPQSPSRLILCDVAKLLLSGLVFSLCLGGI
jgi:hypothetical protein